MNKTFLTLSLFFAVCLNSFADTVFKWVPIYEYNVTEYSDIAEYFDETVISLPDMASYHQGQTNALNIGETYLLKISYGSYYSPYVDSCFIA